MSRSVFAKIALIGAMMFALFVCPLVASASPIADFDFSDIKYWVGTGSNEAALVIDFQYPPGDPDHSGVQSFAWGYRWDGTATGEDMFRAIAGTTVLRDRDGGDFLGTYSGADSHLYLRSSSFGDGLANSVFGIGYDVDESGGSFVSTYEGDETGYATNPTEDYREGWFNGYWSYWISDPDPDTGNTSDESWGYSGLGFSSRVLVDGSWDGWSYADFNAGDFGTQPEAPTAVSVPEPASLGLLVLAGGFVVLRRRK